MVLLLVKCDESQAADSRFAVGAQGVGEQIDGLTHRVAGLAVAQMLAASVRRRKHPVVMTQGAVEPHFLCHGLDYA